MSRIHILHIVPTLRAGGMELAMSRIVQGLPADEFSHSIAVLKGDPLIRDRFGPEVSITCLHAGSRDLLVPWRLRQLIDQLRPSLIHARNLAAWPEVAVARLGIWPTPPLVFSFHGLAEARPVPLRWRLLSRLLARISTRVFTVSEGSRRFLVSHLGIPTSRILVIPNGVDTDRFFPQPAGGPSGTLMIGTVGSLTAVKNQALLVRACAELLQRGVRLRLEIAGDGPERASLSALIGRLGITEHAQLLGEVHDIPAFLNRLDIFVLPSDSEAHPNALSEAMACGRACIATRVGGIPEITDQGRVVRLINAGDEGDLAAALFELASDPKLRRSIGESALQLTRERYSMHKMLERYHRLYSDLATRSVRMQASEP